MRRYAILIADLFACLMLIEWCRFGPWIDWIGYNVYHSRGDVWLATPPAAINFFRGMVSTGSAIVAIIFLAASIMLFLRGRRLATSAGRSDGFHYNAFYGSSPNLFVKYFALLFGTGISPYFYNLIWRYQGNRSLCIAGGLMITIGLVLAIMLVGNLSIVRMTSKPGSTAGD